MILNHQFSNGQMLYTYFKVWMIIQKKVLLLFCNLIKVFIVELAIHTYENWKKSEIQKTKRKREENKFRLK
jgi:hypothetical protein